MLRVTDVTFSYGTSEVLRGISLEVPRGKLMSVLGPSGCGKTTLLNCLAGFNRPSSGRIEIDERDITEIPAESRGFGIVFQEYALFPHMTVFDNVAFGLRVRRLPKATIDKTVRETLSLVGLSMHLDRFPSQLSGGQRQRVALARALAPRPSVLLLDEPLTALDRALRVQLQDELRQLHRVFDIPAVMVTHDPEEALAISDLVLLLQEGQVLQCGSPGVVFDHPVSPVAMAYLGRVVELVGTTQAVGDSFAEVLVAASGDVLRLERSAEIGKPGDRVRLMFRPERLSVLDVNAPRQHASLGVGYLCGMISDVVHKGSYADIWVTLARGERIVASIPTANPMMGELRNGHHIRIEVGQMAVQCFRVNRQEQS